MEHFPVSQDRIDRRAEFFYEMGTRFVNSPILAGVGFTFDQERAQTLAEAYFLLSESYKAYRNEPDHRSEYPKISALTCAAICAINPLRPTAADFENLHVRYANAMFAMRCGSVIIEHPWHTRAFEERRRTYDELSITHFPCLDRYIADVNNGTRQPLGSYNIKNDRFSAGITRAETSKIESLVTRFCIYAEMKIWASKK